MKIWACLGQITLSKFDEICPLAIQNQGPVVQSAVSLTSSLRVISLTVLTDSIYSILIFLLKKCEHFFSKKFQNICVSLDVNFNESLTNDVVHFEQLGPDLYNINAHTKFGENPLEFTQAIIWKRNTDRHTNVQCETIIPRQYHVAGYKKTRSAILKVQSV